MNFLDLKKGSLTSSTVAKWSGLESERIFDGFSLFHNFYLFSHSNTPVK